MNRSKINSNSGAKSAHPSFRPGFWEEREMGESYSEPRGVKGSKEDQVRSGPSLEAVGRRIQAKMDIRAAYVMLEGRPVTLGKYVVSSGGAGIVSALVVMVVIMLMVVVMVVGARQT